MISQRALHYASALAGWYDARLTVLHMFPLMPVMDVPPPVLDDETRARLMEDLQRFTACVPRTATLDLRVEKCEAVHEGTTE